MNIESKARAGFTSIMLRGGRMTKWKGQVASYAPQVGHLQSVSVAAMAAALAFGGAMAVPSEAQAQDVTVVVDSGAPAPVAEVNNGDGALIIRATVPVTGVEATNAASATDLDIETDDITSPSNGVLATNNGSGLTSVNTTAGVVSATGGSGISVKTFGNGLDINAGQVSGSNIGISAENVGLGVTNVTATGPISGGFSHGVSVFTDGLTSDVNVNVADVSSGEKAITVTRNGGGPGDINITSTGTLNSFALGNISTVGVEASIQADTAQGNINIDVANIVAGAGIVTKNFAEGGTSIASSGTITSTAGSGVHVVQGGQGFDVNIDVNDVNAKTVGIVAQNFGGGDVVIDAHDVTGGTGGISSFVNGGGTISITTTGTVNGGADGDGIAVTAAAGQTLPTPISIFSASSGGFGILANEPIVNINVGTVTGGENGIAVTNEEPGDTLITSTGKVTGQKLVGVSAINGVDAINLTIDLVDVEGNTYGVYAINNGIGASVLSVTGTATGNSRDGIHAENNGSTGDLSVTANIVSGGRDGIEAINNGNGVSTIIINGIVDGKNGDGIRAINNGDTQGLSVFSNDISATASITGSNYGIFAQNEGSNGTVINVAGLVKGTASNGIYVYNGANTSTLEITANNVEGALDAIKAINKGTDNTTITLNGSVTGGAGYNGIYATNAASAKDLTITSTALSVAGAATVEGDVNGILAVNDGVGGSTTVLSLGKVVGTTASGIDVVNEVGTVDLSVTANDVEGALNAIKAINNGTGDTSVTLTGTATGGAGFNGINVTNDATAGNLLVNATKLAVADANGVVAATVQGGDNGILAVNNGTGFTTVKAAGKIVGTTGNGVEVSNAAVGTADPATGNVLSVEVNDVEGAQNGIFAINNGTGNALVKATGTVTGTAGNGISLANNQNGLDMTIEANNVTGGLIGISAVNNAKGATNVTATGAVTGQAAEGIRASNVASGTNIKVDALGDVSGATSGILVDNDGSGFSLVKVGGNVTGGAAFSGISADNATTAKDLTITATNANATIEGGYNGIRAINRGVDGSTTVSAAGTVVGTSNAGIFASNEVNTLNLTVNANNVTGGTDGIFAENKGTESTTITATGLVVGSNGAAISASNSGTNLTISAVDLGASLDAVKASNIGTGDTTVTISGIAAGGQYDNGLNVLNATTAKNMTINATKLSLDGVATIVGGLNGILADNDGIGGSTSITALGKTAGTTGDGINANNAVGTVNLAINAGSVEGGDNGILAVNNGTGFTTVKAAGKIVGTTGNGVEVSNAAVGTADPATGNVLSVEVNDVEGAQNGIFAINNGTGNALVKATGTVTGTAGNGISLANNQNGLDMTIEANNVTGGLIGISAVNNAKGATNVTATGTVTGQAAEGIRASNLASGTNIKVDALGDVSGNTAGILVDNDGSGFSLVKVGGNVTGGATFSGISADNATTAKDLTITATNANATIEGGYNGIRAINRGVDGSTTVSAAGTVVGTSNAGIFASNEVNTLNLTVNANNVTGGTDGIFAENKGTGFTTVTASGAVTGGAGYNGIYATNAASAKDLTISSTALSVAGAATVEGDVNGILAVNKGVGGSTSVTAAGKVVGRSYNGIDATNNTGTVDLTITAADVSGASTGILALNYGSGATTVISTGTVTGTDEDGIIVYGSGAGDITVRSVNVSGEEGIDVTNFGNGSSTFITSTGNVEGKELNGIYAYNSAAAKNLTIAAVNVSGFRNGIFAENQGTGSTTITVSGNVTGGADDDGIYALNGAGTINLAITANDVEGGVRGVYAYNQGTGTTKITATGLVKGTDGDGILAVVRGTAGDLSIVANNVEAADEGIDVDNQGTGSTSITATGLVKGNNIGIFAYNGANTDNLTIVANNVEGTARDGIETLNYGTGSTLITFSGNVSGGVNGNGVSATNAASAKDLTISSTALSVAGAATVQGGDNGIFAVNNGVGGSTSVTVAGKVIGQNSSGIEVQNEVGTLDVKITANDVVGGADGISARNKGTGSTIVNASGSVNGGSLGIDVFNDETALDIVVNANNVTSEEYGIYSRNTGKGVNSVSATGLIRSLSGTGIQVHNGGSASNLVVSAKDVEAAKNGIYTHNQGTGPTLITISGNVTGGAAFSGISADNAATAKDLTITATNANATVQGGLNGILAVNNGVGGSTTVSILGKVVGTTGDGIHADNALETQNLTVVAHDVTGLDDGIEAFNDGVGETKVIATGSVTGTNGDGIDVTSQNQDGTGLIVQAVNVSGGAKGINATNRGNGSTSVVTTGDVVSTGITANVQNDGIYATNRNAGSVDLTVTAVNVTGADRGIRADNEGGSGTTTVTSTGTVKGIQSGGIFASNGQTATDIAVNANTVEGTYGIAAENDGVGSTTIKVDGFAKGLTSDGIFVSNGANATDITVTAKDVEGFKSGINSYNSGKGTTSISVSGNVTGGVNNSGIDAVNAVTTKDLIINATSATATVKGGVNGIRAINNGVGGSTTVTAAGTVAGTTDAGIFASNEVNTLNLTVSANDVTGGTIGINASNKGTGSTLVKSTGLVSGANGEGILAVNEGTSLSIDATDVTGSADAIDATNNGSDFTSIVLRGNVTAGRIGVDVKNAATAKDVTIIAANPAAVITGANNGIVVNNSGKDASTSITVAGDVIGTNLAGINVQNNSGTANLTINAADVSGGTDGIYSLNAGTGFTRITTSGVVAGDNKGISANNLASASDLTINAHIVSGEKAIIALNQGTGSTSVRTTGLVTGTVGNAISVTNQALAESLAIDVVDVTANVENGIDAINNGKGVTALTVRGDVNAGRVGINILNAESAKDVTIAAADIATSIVGGNNGIIVTNFGQGASTSIAVAGSVEGTKLTGITVQNNIGAANLTISANNVKGGTDGIFAINQGTGSTEIKTSGVVEGVLKGISVNNSASAKDLTINAANVAGSITGGVNGILALNNGIDGSTTITAAGTVTGTTNAGISASNEVNSLNLTINANNVTGGAEGLVAFNGGKGATTLDAKGDIKGVRDGVHIENTATASTLAVSVKNVTGGIDGLDVINDGTGASTVSISGKVAGGTGVGVATTSKAGKLTTINLAATADVSATSGNAITNNLGDSVLNVANGAVITGTVRLGDGSDTANILLSSTAAFAGITALDGGDNFAAADGFVDTLNLNGAGSFDLVGARVTNWELINFNAGTVGFSDALITAGALNVSNGATLNAANSLVATANVNVATSGTLLAGNSGGTSNARIVGNLTSAGVVNLSGTVGKAGDKLNVTANFTGANGQVRLDTVLQGDNSPTDSLNITGNAIGSTLLAVTNVGGAGGLTLGDGIKLVQVGGKSDQTAFRLLGEELQAGGFRYGLFLGGIADPNDQDWYLRTAGLSDVAATSLSFARLSDDIAMTFLGTLHERVGEQEHLAKRGYNGGAMSGLWGRFVGKGFRERLSSRILGDVKSNGSITGLQMGLDIVRNVKGDGSATFAGIYAGHADGSSSDQNVFRGTARQSGASKSDGWLTGIYGTHFAPSGWYANAVIQSNWLDAKAIGRNGTTLETDGRTWLGSVELGKALKLAERAEFETQVQLIYGNTKFDTALDSSGAENRVDIENSLIGRVGFRLKTTKGEKYNAEGGLFSGYLKANLWHNLSGADVELTNAGQSVGGFEPKKTWVDAGLGTTLTMSQNTELFFDADVEFGIDQKTTAGTGKVGLRINW